MTQIFHTKIYPPRLFSIYRDLIFDIYIDQKIYPDVVKDKWRNQIIKAIKILLEII